MFKCKWIAPPPINLWKILIILFQNIVLYFSKSRKYYLREILEGHQLFCWKLIWNLVALSRDQWNISEAIKQNLSSIYLTVLMLIWSSLKDWKESYSESNIIIFPMKTRLNSIKHAPIILIEISRKKKP